MLQTPILFLWPPGPRLLRSGVGARREARQAVVRHGGRDCKPPARTLPHPRATLRSSSVTGRRRRRPHTGGSERGAPSGTSRRAGCCLASGGLLPGVRRAVLLPPLPPLPPPPPPLRWRPRSLEPGKPRLRARSSGVGTSTEEGAVGALRPQSPRRGGGGPGLGRQSRACISA